jgi:hypothetical protein
MKTTTRDIVRTGDVYLIPLLQERWAIATIISAARLEWDASLPIMLIGVHNAVVTGRAREHLPTEPMKHYWCYCSFIGEGHWLLVRSHRIGALWRYFLGRDKSAESEQPAAQTSVWATYELFVDDLRQHLGLERQTYTGAQFTFSRTCGKCTKEFDIGLARCPHCGTIRGEFAGMEQFVTDHTGFCYLSGAKTDVRGPDGEYYWAPYFIDRVRTGKITVAKK